MYNKAREYRLLFRLAPTLNFILVKLLDLYSLIIWRIIIYIRITTSKLIGRRKCYISILNLNYYFPLKNSLERLAIIIGAIKRDYLSYKKLEVYLANIAEYTILEY